MYSFCLRSMRTFTYTWESDNRLLHLLKYFEIISKFGKLSSGHRAGKRSVFIPIPKKGSAKECSNYSTIALISHASKIMLKILQVWLQSTWTKNFQVFKLDLEKAEEPEIKLPISTGSQKRKRIPEKHLLLLYWLRQSLWLCGSQQTVENS